MILLNTGGGEDIDFPEDSNCSNCFWKPEQQLRKNFETNAPVMYWSMIWEDLMGHTLKDKYSLHQIQQMAMQLDFFFGTGSGCQAGFCTD